jgi:hypothetical protein
MYIIICLDDNNGLAFNHRKRIYGSKDSALKAIGKQFENKIVPSKDKLKWNAQML